MRSVCVCVLLGLAESCVRLSCAGFHQSEFAHLAEIADSHLNGSILAFFFRLVCLMGSFSGVWLALVGSGTESGSGYRLIDAFAVAGPEWKRVGLCVHVLARFCSCLCACAEWEGVRLV